MFCGTKSFGKIFEKNGWEVISLDIDEKRKPTIVADILLWDYKMFDKNYFNHIHFSPPCIYMSQQQQTWYGRLPNATVDDIHAISSTGTVNCVVAALLDDVG